MRLFLSSYRFGSDPTRLLEVTRGPGRVAVIANAGDAWPSRARESSVTSEFGPLRGLGYDPEEVDLRDHLGDPGSLRARLGAFSSVWVRGGNTFVLRAQLARSGGDTVLTDLVGTGALAYAGYSAGACIATPTLRGLEFSDDPAEVVEIGAGPVVWDGLGWVDHAIVPHAGDSLLGDDGVDRTLEYLRRESIPFVALRDDDALVIETDDPSHM
jgi:dipeptidase E